MTTDLKLLGVAFFLISGSGFAETFQTEPVKDNTLFENDNGSFSNGSGIFLFMGRTGADNGIINLARRAVVAFDLSSIPQDATIDRVQISFTIDMVPPNASSDMASLHRLQQDWGEGMSNPPGPEGRGAASTANDVTWIHTFFSASFWTNPGGDFLITPSATTPFGITGETLIFDSAQSPGLIADVAQWVTDPSTNFGWILIGDEQEGMNARRLLSRENQGVGSPTLTVEFTPDLVFENGFETAPAP